MQIDHIVYVVPNLEKGIEAIENQFGVKPTYGGKHEHQGTHNALLNIGNNCYFELIAIDPENSNIPAPRWMGVDLISTSKISRWALKSNDINRDSQFLRGINPSLCSIKTGQRLKQDGSLLKWDLTMPLAAPEVEVLPFLLDWKNSVHPTVDLPQECELVQLKAFHPEPEIILTVLEQLNTRMIVEKSEETRLQLTINTPKGEITLS